MKKLLFLNAFLMFNVGFAQNVQSDTFITSGGLEAGLGVVGGSVNQIGDTFYGYRAGNSIYYKTSRQNTFIGCQSGENNFNGSNNTFIGYKSGNLSYGTFNNTFIGNNSGLNNTGSGNVFIGSESGSTVTTSNNLLFIDNSNTTTPLLWGDFANDQLKLNGKVGVGSITAFPNMAGTVNVSNYQLFVSGGILTEAVRVSLKTGWADYVFNKEYNLPTLNQVEKQIAEDGHLQNVPSAKEVKENGIELAEMAKIQMEKIEELTLYLIQQNKKIQALEAKVKALETKK